MQYINTDYYVNVVDWEVIPKIKSSSSSTSSFAMHNHRLKFHSEPFSEMDVNKKNSKLDNKYSTGYDGVPITVIKDAQSTLLKPLAHLINSSFIAGNFPNKLK